MQSDRGILSTGYPGDRKGIVPMPRPLFALLALLSITLAVIVVAGEPTQPEPAKGVVTKPRLQRPHPPASLKAEELKVKYNDAWNRYDDRVKTASDLLVATLSKYESKESDSEVREKVATFLDDFKRSGEFPVEFSHTPEKWGWRIDPPILAPAHAIALWARREFAYALLRLEEDYALLSEECRKAGALAASGELHRQISQLLDANWTRQRSLIVRREEEANEKAEKAWNKREAKRREYEELKQTVPRTQAEQLLRHGVDVKELVDGKPFLVENAAGRLLFAYLKGTRWTNAFGEVYEWDNSGLLWHERQGKRNFIYAKYAKGKECTIQSPHVQETKLLVDRENTTITPVNAVGRKTNSFTRIEE